MENTKIVKEYLNELNINYEIKTLNDITKLIKAHLKSFPFSSLKVLLKEEISLDLESIYKSIVVKKRGGYCFEHNKLMYEVLKELGFEYSSSVLPAKNPLYGWEEFGKETKKLSNGLFEIPMTVDKFGPLTIPYAGGVYFRILPNFLIKWKVKKNKKTLTPLLGYFHPYDIDFEQEKFMMPGINNSKVYNWLMYYNRKNVFKRLDKIIKQGFEINTYSNYLKSLKK